MKLREYLKEVIFDKPYNIVDDCVEISNQHAIGFSEWKDINCVSIGNGTSIKNPFYITHLKPNKKFTISELLEIYNNLP